MCEVKCKVKIMFEVYSSGTNELEKYKKRVVQRHFFVQGTLAIDQNQSPALPQRWTPSKRAGCPAGRPVFFLSRPRPNVGCLRRPGTVRAQPWTNIKTFKSSNSSTLVFSALYKLQSFYVSEFLLMTKFSYSALEELLSCCKIVILLMKQSDYSWWKNKRNNYFNDQYF